MAQKTKKKNARMPPLSWIDQLIYYGSILLSVCAMIASVAAVILLCESIAFSDTNVIAYEMSWSAFLCFPVSMLFLAYSFILGEQYKKKTPIFGRRNTRYGPPQYKEKYPLFMKNKPSIRITQREKHRQTVTAIVLITATAISLLLYPLSFYGRNALLSDGRVVSYNAFNVQMDLYEPEDIISVTFSTESDKHSKFITVTFRTDDNQQRTFSSGYFRENWLNEMLRIKSRYPEDMISYKETYPLDIFASCENLSEEETDLLYQLFDTER